MIYDIRASIEGYGDVEISHKHLATVIETCLPNTIQGLHDQICQSFGSAGVPPKPKDVSEALLILAFLKRLDWEEEYKRLEYERNMR